MYWTSRPFERDREGEEEAVELRAVEALAEVLAGGDYDERLVVRRPLDLVEEGRACALPETALEHDRRDASASKPGGEQGAVHLPLTEHEAAPTSRECVDHVGANERAALLVLDEQTKQLVNRRLGNTGHRERGLAHVEVEV